MGEIFSTFIRRESSFSHTWTALELLLVALTCTLLTWYLQFLWSRRKLYECSRKLPGPFAFPLVGSALHFIGSPYDIFSNIMKMYNQYPGIFRVWFGPRLFYAVSDPKYYEILLPHCLAKERWYKYSEAAIGHGLFAAPLDKWKRHRKIIMPTFSQKILDGFVEIFSEQSEILVEQMRKFAGEGEFDIFDIMSKCTLDIICETAMGVKVNTQTSADTSLSTCIDRILENIFLRAFVIWYHYDAIFNLTARSKAYKASLKILHDFSGSIRRKIPPNEGKTTPKFNHRVQST
ncbi:cytochrome P450 4C1-like [Anoplophora glabripennis]|uniref:cytochrome P450 4C1-like n=1 Tax=Anoplophora glabripennis TaxID=217634 RepID=UPI000C75C4AD|nr:cytochrome P450 4C1-like [Anoplophora glabripennis]